uniref:Actin-related protein 5 n=1 Tax=Ascaris lumbricoides TaxID=6252 RepID=A0A0M3HHH1_ASCLU
MNFLDEVGALVFDAGSHTFRVGFAGEEFPKGDIPSDVGVQEILDQAVDDTVDQDAQKAAKKRKFYIGNEHLGVPRANTEIQSFMKDGMGNLHLKIREQNLAQLGTSD